MGRSTSSCLKIMTCAGGDTAEDDVLDPTEAPAEAKASSDKRRWSFRKRSARHRVLSNNAISEPLSAIFSKENLEDTSNIFPSPINSSILEKPQMLEKPIEAVPLAPEIGNSGIVDKQELDKNNPVTDGELQDSVSISIQAAVRGFLARRELQKTQSVIKLQAVVRGHLVRRQAIGTLRCVHAIMKMQALVRARHAHHRSTSLEGGYSSIKANKASSSIKKLLSNRFACQLLESTPKTTPIHIKCDPSRSDSAWKWLERWMDVTSSDVEQQQKWNYDQSNLDVQVNSNLVHNQAANEVPVAENSVSSEANIALSQSEKTDEGEENFKTTNSDVFVFGAPTFAIEKCRKDEEDHSKLSNEVMGPTEENHTKVDITVQEISESLSDVISDAISQPTVDYIPDKSESDRRGSKHARNASFDSIEIEGKRFGLGLRKTCNPAFAAAQSKFEELSSNYMGGRPIRAVCQDAAVEPKLGSLHSRLDLLAESKGFSFSENSISHDSRAQMATSECGTEISISSTLDSPDRSETEGGEIVLELGALEKRNYDVNSGASQSVDDAKLNGEKSIAPLDSETLQPPRGGDHDDHTVIAADGSIQVEKQPREETMSDMQTEAENPMDRQGYRSSPEGSPRSRATVVETHGTPSSQVSVNTKKNKDSDRSIRKTKAQMVGKNSPSNLDNGSTGRSSIELLQKDAKNAKRRTSFGVAKPDVDHEPRISSSNSLPSYMQATESARAKAHASISPKASPEVNDKEYTKKRHSLPIANGKQGSSPRMQRSASQAQQNPKGNETHSPHNSTERRWQR